MSDNFRKEFTRSSHIKISQKALGKKPSWQNLPAVRSLNSPCQPPPKKKNIAINQQPSRSNFQKKSPKFYQQPSRSNFQKKKNKFYQQPSRSTFQNNPPNFTNNHPGQMLVPKKKNPLPHLLQACFVSSS